MLLILMTSAGTLALVTTMLTVMVSRVKCGVKSQSSLLIILSSINGRFHFVSPEAASCKIAASVLLWYT